MKANLALRLLGSAAATALVAAGLTAGAVAPAQAATKSTVTLLSTADIDSLNSGTSDGNTAYNALVGSLTGMGFTYYDNNANLVMNTRFGTMQIVKNTAKDFRIEYTVRSGQQWSDGTPIDAVDLLLTHVVASGKYSKAAGLGDPKDTKNVPAFDSVSYGGTYDEFVVGEPVLSANNMKLTVRFSKPLPDWELLAPGPSPVHSLVLLADGKKGLQSASVNAAAKAQFLKDFTSKNSTRLKAMGKVWSTGYDVTKVDSSTNPLLLISNGGFIVSKFTFGDSMTFVRNARYSSGPAMATRNPIRTVVIKIIKDNTAAVQALRNGDIDIYYNTLGSATDKTALSAMSNVSVITRAGGNYSHLGIRTGTVAGQATYTGPFAGNSQKAKDLRKAFLLAVPREQMVATIVKPVSETATPMDTHFAFPGTPAYNTITKGSGVSIYSKGTQAERTAQALALVKKWYPDATADNPVVKINFLHANTSLRNALGRLIEAEAAKAGFIVTRESPADFFGNLENSKYDASMYGFALTSISQANGVATYQSDGGNNTWGWNDPTIDKLATRLKGDIVPASEINSLRLAIDKRVISNYWGLALYANPTITAFNKDLKNVKPAPIGNNVTWNYFEWSY
jgi:peptide/nickel transport system substrate-binding protein